MTESCSRNSIWLEAAYSRINDRTQSTTPSPCLTVGMASTLYVVVVIVAAATMLHRHRYPHTDMLAVSAIFFSDAAVAGARAANTDRLSGTESHRRR